ncbi:MAG: helix-turn-helix domain-containing protein [Myxococcota bacterium]
MAKDSLRLSKAFKQEDFTALYREAPGPREKARYLTLLLVQRTDLSVSEIGAALRVSPMTIHNRLNAYRRRQEEKQEQQTDASRAEPPKFLAREDFTKLYRNSRNADDKIRFLALSLLRQGGRSVQEVASILRVSRATVYDWLNRYRERGLEGVEKGRRLKTKRRKGGGRKKILSGEQQLLVEETAERFAKDSSGKVGGRLLVRELLKRGIRCSETSVYRWLAQARGRNRERDP